jgi:hypothetical protein
MGLVLGVSNSSARGVRYGWPQATHTQPSTRKIVTQPLRSKKLGSDVGRAGLEPATNGFATHGSC